MTTRSYFERDKSRGPNAWVLNLTDGSVYCTLSRVHRDDQCVGDHCVIHNPSPHNMVTWPLMPRDGLMERICQHGIGHPDPDSVAFLTQTTGDDSWNVHGCDGCCTRARRSARYLRPTRRGQG